MLKAYDIKCKVCGKVREVLMESIDGIIMDEFPNCICGGETKRIFSKFNFKLKYDNKKDSCGWSFNDYESSHYWDDVKKERQNGNNVRPVNDK